MVTDMRTAAPRKRLFLNGRSAWAEHTTEWWLLNCHLYTPCSCVGACLLSNENHIAEYDRKAIFQALSSLYVVVWLSISNFACMTFCSRRVLFLTVQKSCDMPVCLHLLLVLPFYAIRRPTSYWCNTAVTTSGIHAEPTESFQVQCYSKRWRNLPTAFLLWFIRNKILCFVKCVLWCIASDGNSTLTNEHQMSTCFFQFHEKRTHDL